MVVDFLGISQMDWSEYDIHATTGTYHGKTTPTVSPQANTELTRFFKRRGSKYYDLVSQIGYYGCQAVDNE